MGGYDKVQTYNYVGEGAGSYGKAATPSDERGCEVPGCCHSQCVLTWLFIALVLMGVVFFAASAWARSKAHDASGIDAPAAQEQLDNVSKMSVPLSTSFHC